MKIATAPHPMLKPGALLRMSGTDGISYFKAVDVQPYAGGQVLVLLEPVPFDGTQEEVAP